MLETMTVWSVRIYIVFALLVFYHWCLHSIGFVGIFNNTYVIDSSYMCYHCFDTELYVWYGDYLKLLPRLV